MIRATALVLTLLTGFSGLVYEETRGVLKELKIFLENVIRELM